MTSISIKKLFLVTSLYTASSQGFAIELDPKACYGSTQAAGTTLPTQPEYATGTPVTVKIDDNGTIKDLDYIRIDDMAVFEGDIVIGNAQQIEFDAQAGPIKTLKSNNDASDLTPFGYVARSVINGANRWPDGLIPFVIDPQLSSLVIKQAMQAWESATKIRFLELTPENSPAHKNYVHFTPGTRPGVCLTNGVGMSRGALVVSLVKDCGFGEIVHEIGHVIGLDHEQNRSDRDQYVTVNTSNVQNQGVGQFKQRPSLYKDIGSYDYDSIMHYQGDAFTCNNKPTIVANESLPPGVRLGQRSHISEGDAAAVNLFYK